jgi:hypothetical protein
VDLALDASQIAHDVTAAHRHYLEVMARLVPHNPLRLLGWLTLPAGIAASFFFFARPFDPTPTAVDCSALSHLVPQ